MYQKTEGPRFHHKETNPTINKAEIQKEIKKESKTKTGISNLKIHYLLRNFPNFLGCFAEDELKSLIIKSLPVSFIVNFDHSGLGGSHWILIRIDRRRLELFDPLGFNIRRWPRIPYFLLDFLHKFSIHRKVFITKEIQPYNSTLCGYYCIFFLYYRSFHSFFACTRLFSINLYKNDLILINLFNKI